MGHGGFSGLPTASPPLDSISQAYRCRQTPSALDGVSPTLSLQRSRRRLAAAGPFPDARVRSWASVLASLLCAGQGV